jgi:hypothetical protein
MAVLKELCDSILAHLELRAAEKVAKIPVDQRVQVIAFGANELRLLHIAPHYIKLAQAPGAKIGQLIYCLLFEYANDSIIAASCDG